MAAKPRNERLLQCFSCHLMNNHAATAVDSQPALSPAARAAACTALLSWVDAVPNVGVAPSRDTLPIRSAPAALPAPAKPLCSALECAEGTPLAGTGCPKAAKGPGAACAMG